MTERLEDLKARSKEVLIKVKPEVREKLIRFARTSRDPKTGKPSPTKAEKRALQSTGDADKALACWQLTAILRDFGEEEFEKHVSDICQKSHQETVSQIEQKPKPEEKMGEKKHLNEIEFSFPKNKEIVIREGYPAEKKTIRFLYSKDFEIFLCEMLEALGEVDITNVTLDGRTILRDLMIRILKKKFGYPGKLTRLCPNCYDPDCFLFERAPGEFWCPCCEATYSNKEEETKYCCINYSNGCGGPELKKIGDKHYKCPVCNEEYRLNEEGKLLD